MTDSSYTHILAIVDRSGSMSWGRADKEMAAALNSYFREQGKLEGKCLVDYVQFDNTSELLFQDVEVDKAEAVIHPRGSTALLDAIGNASTNLGKKLARLPEALRPGKVQVVIVTDGGENSSWTWGYADVKALITEQTDKYQWDFVFLGANIDAVEVGETFGINPNKALTFNIADHDAVVNTSQILNNYTTTYRAAGASAANFSDDDRTASMVGKTSNKSS